MFIKLFDYFISKLLKNHQVTEYNLSSNLESKFLVFFQLNVFRNSNT
jgi:hypothetical protein